MPRLAGGMAGKLMPRRHFRLASGVIAALVGGLLLHSAFAKPQLAPLEAVPVPVSVQPLPRFKVNDDGRRFGFLDYRGGLVLSSPFPGFGGISAFTFDGPDGHFLALTDAGLFLEGRLATAGDRPVGLTDVTAIAIRDGKGRPFAAQGSADSESLALAPGAVYVGFEGKNQIWRYARPAFGASGKLVPAPAIRRLKRNLGLESLVFVPHGPLKGALLGIGEEDPVRADTLPGFIIGGRTAGTFTLTRKDAFNATDAALTPDGRDVILLERHFTRLTGVKMRLRRFPLAAVKPGAVIDPEVLGTFDMGYEIDNMEGLAVSTSKSGETLLTLISDDNFSVFQRTVLLRFALIPD